MLVMVLQNTCILCTMRQRHRVVEKHGHARALGVIEAALLYSTLILEVSLSRILLDPRLFMFKHV